MIILYLNLYFVHGISQLKNILLVVSTVLHHIFVHMNVNCTFTEEWIFTNPVVDSIIWLVRIQFWIG